MIYRLSPCSVPKGMYRYERVQYISLMSDLLSSNLPKLDFLRCVQSGFAGAFGKSNMEEQAM